MVQWHQSRHVNNVPPHQLPVDAIRWCSNLCWTIFSSMSSLNGFSPTTNLNSGRCSRRPSATRCGWIFAACMHGSFGVTVLLQQRSPTRPSHGRLSRRTGSNGTRWYSSMPATARIPSLRKVSLVVAHRAQVCSLVHCGHRNALASWRTPQTGLSNSASPSMRCVIVVFGTDSASNSHSEKLSCNIVGVVVHEQL